MFRSTRDDTLIRTIEARYGIELHARGDTKLGNLLTHRGFFLVVSSISGTTTSLRTSSSISRATPP